MVLLVVDRTDTMRQRRENLHELFTSLKKEPWQILVEGRRDQRALVLGGIEKSKIVMLHGKALLDVEDVLADKEEVILLLDYDREGLQLMNHFKRNLQRVGVRVNTWFWSKIREICNGHIDCIENLKVYFK